VTTSVTLRSATPIKVVTPDGRTMPIVSSAQLAAILPSQPIEVARRCLDHLGMDPHAVALIETRDEVALACSKVQVPIYEELLSGTDVAAMRTYLARCGVRASVVSRIERPEQARMIALLVNTHGVDAVPEIADA
jgi:hypothetical protein